MDVRLNGREIYGSPGLAQGHVKGRPPSEGALHADRAAVELDDVFDNGQPQAGPPLVAAAAGVDQHRWRFAKLRHDAHALDAGLRIGKRSDLHNLHKCLRFQFVMK